MATTQNTFNGDGSSLGPFSFTFKWLRSSDIKVSVNNVLKTLGTHYNLQSLNYTTKTGGQVLFTAGNAPAAGTGNIRVYRETDDSTLIANFSSGSAIRAADLNNNFTQELYKVQENTNYSVQDVGNVSLIANYTFSGTVAGQTPTTSNQFATKSYVDSVSLAGTPDGNRGDITVSSSGTVWSIAAGVVTDADINASAGIADTKLATISTAGKVNGTAITSGNINTSGSFSTSSTISDGSGSIRIIPQNSQTSAYTLTASDTGKHISITTGGVTVPTAFSGVGNVVTIYNNSGSNQTITQGASTTLRQGGTANTGNRTLAQYGVATILCVASNTFIITGSGLS
jgi:hypothetical protein